MEKESNSKLNLIFAKAEFVNEKEQEMIDNSKDVTVMLERWFDEHNNEIQANYDETVAFFGEWFYPAGSEYIRMEFSVGCGAYCYYQAIALYPNVDWKFIPYNR
jgi:hypothetical protein